MDRFGGDCGLIRSHVIAPLVETGVQGDGSGRDGVCGEADERRLTEFSLLLPVVAVISLISMECVPWTMVETSVAAAFSSLTAMGGMGDDIGDEFVSLLAGLASVVLLVFILFELVTLMLVRALLVSCQFSRLINVCARWSNDTREKL